MAQGKIPSDVEKRLREVFGADVEIVDTVAEQKRMFSEDPSSIPAQPLTLEKARWLLTGDWIPVVGDIVKLREDMPFSMAHMKWPTIGETCVVSYVMPRERWGQNGDQGSNFQLNSIALAWGHRCGDDECPMEEALVEYAHDHRLFQRVGHVMETTPPAIGRPKIPGMSIGGL